MLLIWIIFISFWVAGGTVGFAVNILFRFDEPCGDIILHVNTEMERRQTKLSFREQERCKIDPSLISIQIWLNLILF